MNEKNTDELKKILKGTHLSEFERYCRENGDSMLSEASTFSVFMKEEFRRKGITQQKVFLEADIPERYGYKLLSGEKHTKQRDIILRLCYAAGLTLDETQRALKKYEMPELYSKIPRDALLMIVFNERCGSIIEVNALLKKHGMEPLRTSGFRD